MNRYVIVNSCDMVVGIYDKRPDTSTLESVARRQCSWVRLFQGKLVNNEIINLDLIAAFG